MSRDGNGMSNLKQTLANPAIQSGLGILTTARPDIGIALQIVATIADGLHDNPIIKIIETKIANHITRLASDKNLHELERREIETRLHELLSIVVQVQ